QLGRQALAQRVLPLRLVAADQVRAVVELVQQGGDLRGVVLQIGVQRHQQPPAGLLDTGRQRGGLAEVPAQPDAPHARGPGGLLGDHLPAAVGAPVVDHQQFPGPVLAVHRRADLFDQLRQTGLLVLRRGQQRDFDLTGVRLLGHDTTCGVGVSGRIHQPSGNWKAMRSWPVCAGATASKPRPISVPMVWASASARGMSTTPPPTTVPDSSMTAMHRARSMPEIAHPLSIRAPPCTWSVSTFRITSRPSGPGSRRFPMLGERQPVVSARSPISRPSSQPRVNSSESGWWPGACRRGSSGSGSGERSANASGWPIRAATASSCWFGASSRTCCAIGAPRATVASTVPPTRAARWLRQRGQATAITSSAIHSAADMLLYLLCRPAASPKAARETAIIAAQPSAYSARPHQGAAARS